MKCVYVVNQLSYGNGTPSQFEVMCPIIEHTNRTPSLVRMNMRMHAVPCLVSMSFSW